MSELIKATNMLPNLFAGADLDDNDDLSSGVSGGFSVVSYRGGKWRVKHGGEETLLVNGEGEAMPSIRVVMLKANKNVSKNYYEGAFVEGSTDSPACWSVDGIRPDTAVPEPINDTCGPCPYNQFGSRVTDTGSKAKRCADSRRLAIVPEGDFANEAYDGPMLLRVPAASLAELATFGKAMKAKGYPYNTIITKISFDPDVAYPRLKFQAVRPITTDERDQLTGLLTTEQYLQKIEFILAQAVEVAQTEAQPEPVTKEQDPTEFEESAPAPKKAATVAPAKPAPAKPTVVKPKPAPVVAAAPAPKVETKAESAVDSELDDILAKLDSLE